MAHTRFQLRQDTAANWTSNNPVLLSGEEGFETDTGNKKTGDGVSQWNNLQYISRDTLYLLTAHRNTTQLNQLAVGVSRDGRSFSPLGNTLASQNFTTGVRDPDPLFYPPTGEFVIAYTRAVNTTTFQATIGLAKTRDFLTWTELPAISVGGISPAFTWSGSWFVDNGNYYLLFLPLGPSGNKATFGPGWIQCLNPGTWSSWTPFVSLTSSNPNWTQNDLNDPYIVNVNGTYHLFTDSTSGGIMHATSASPLTGYSALVSVAGMSGREGAIFTPLEDGTFRLYSQATYGAMQYIESPTPDFASASALTDIAWPGFRDCGNGGVIRLDTFAKQAPVIAAIAQSTGILADDASYATGGVRLPFQEFIIRMNASLTGNGPSASDDRPIITIQAFSDDQSNNFIQVFGAIISETGNIIAESNSNPPMFTARTSAGGLAPTYAWQNPSYQLQSQLQADGGLCWFLNGTQVLQFRGSGGMYLNGPLDFDVLTGASAASAKQQTRQSLGSPAVQIATTTGDPAAPNGSEPTLCINTVDHNFKIYADSAWRLITSW